MGIEICTRKVIFQVFLLLETVLLDLILVNKNFVSYFWNIHLTRDGIRSTGRRDWRVAWSVGDANPKGSGVLHDRCRSGYSRLPRRPPEDQMRW